MAVWLVPKPIPVVREADGGGSAESGPWMAHVPASSHGWLAAGRSTPPASRLPRRAPSRKTLPEQNKRPRIKRGPERHGVEARDYSRYPESFLLWMIQMRLPPLSQPLPAKTRRPWPL